MTTFRSIIALALGAALMSFTGCSRADKEDAKGASNATTAAASTATDKVGEGAAVQEDVLGRLFASAEELYFGGDTNGAVALLAKAVDLPEYAEERRQIFSMLVRTELGAGMVDSARARMLAAYKDDPELAEDACGAVFYHYSGQGDNQAAADWTDEVLKIKNLSSTVCRNVREWNFLSHIAIGNADKVVALSRGFVDDAPADDAIRILRRGVDVLFDKRDTEVVSRILATAGRTVTSDVPTRNLLSTIRLRLSAEKGDWGMLRDSFRNSYTSFSDEELLYAMRKIQPAISKARKYDTADAIFICAITNDAQRPMSYGYAARQWVASAVATDIHDIPERIEFLTDRGRQMPDVCSIFIRHAYEGVDDVEFVNGMKAVGDRLIPLATDEDTRSAIRTAVLDFAFVLEDYDSAIKYLEAGIPGYDRNWHEMALSKVKAHKALKENRPLDAIREFRGFMAVVRTSEETETSDPATGMVHTREMILGRNAKRIGDIYASIPDAEKAAAAYEEARGYYRQALETTTDPETVEFLKKEMGQVPAK